MSPRVQLEGSQPHWPYFLVAAGTALFTYLHVFRFPFVPIWHMGDESSYLDHADRMLHGQILYKDLFQFNFPGTEYLYYFIFRCCGLHLWAGHLAFLITVTAVNVLIFALARVVLSGAAAILPSIAFLGICVRSNLDGTHHWYSNAFALLAVYLIARERTTRRIQLAGGLLGMATLFTSTRGIAIAVGLALFLFWEFRDWRVAAKACTNLLVPFAATVGLALAYLVRLAGSRVLFDSLVVFPLRYYPAGAANSFSVYYDPLLVSGPFKLSLILGIGQWFATSGALPILLVVFAVMFVRSRANALPTSVSNRTLVLYATVSLFALLAAIGAPSAPRLNCALAFAYILGAAMLSKAGNQKLAATFLAVLFVVCLAEMTAALVRPVYFVNGPRGRIAFFTADRREYVDWFILNTHPGDLLFGDVDINFLLGLENPAAIQWLERDAYTRPEQVSALIHALELRNTRFVVYYESYGQGSEDNLQPIRDYLKLHYRVVEKRSDAPGLRTDPPACSDCPSILSRHNPDQKVACAINSSDIDSLTRHKNRGDRVI